MLRLFCIALLLFLSVAAHANGGITDTVRAKDDRVHAYYLAQNLRIDSAATPFLYYNIYAWLGTAYKYSGDNKKGIDCSGFVSRMYSDVYCIALSGGSRDIFPRVQPVEKNELREGDLLFFKIRKGQISHVGVYLGNNKFAHATVRSGVIISDLDEEYYKRYFYKGGRIASAN